MTQSSELQQLIALVQIESVRLLESAARTTIDPTQVRPAELLIRHGATLAMGISDDGRFVVNATVEARVVPKQEPQPQSTGERPLPVWDVEPLIAARFVHELTYFVPPKSSFSDETLSEFARINGVFNAWPYWRQLFQSVASEMGLPRVVFPVFRAGNFDARLKPENRAAQMIPESIQSPKSDAKNPVKARRKKQ